MILKIFGDDENNLPYPLSRKECVEALKEFSKLNDSMGRNLAWCHYCDIRDRIKPGTTAQQFVNRTMVTFGFVSACHKQRGWTNVKHPNGMSVEADEATLQALEAMARAKRGYSLN